MTKNGDFTDIKKFPCFFKGGGVKDLPLEILISQSKPSLIYPGFEVVIKCYNYDLEYKLKNTEENWKAKHDEAEAPEIVFLKDPFSSIKKF